MNPFILFLIVCEALISVMGLVYAIYCIAAGVHIVGVLIGLFTFVIFAMFTVGMWSEQRHKKAMA